jgi:IS30 family transposase
MNHYTHLTIEEREKAMVLKEKGLSIRAIARILNRTPSTISREFKRNSYANGKYSANRAQKEYKLRQRDCGPKPKILNPYIREYVTERLLMGWSAEQISGRAVYEKQDFNISYNTIYRAVDNGFLSKKYKQCMRFKRKYKRHKSIEKRGTIQNTTSIHERPETANNRTEIGHWEADTVLGQRNTGCFGTFVERKTGFLVAFRMDDLRNNVFNKEAKKVFECVPEILKKSITVDNGTEFTYHKELSNDTKMKIYFCDPYSPWQRGTNENTNGLLRYFFPKGSSFATVSDNDLRSAVNLINNRPRKRFGFKSPYEMILSELFFCCT